MPTFVATFTATVSVGIEADSIEDAKDQLADALADGSEALRALDVENDPAVTCGEQSPRDTVNAAQWLEINK